MPQQVTIQAEDGQKLIIIYPNGKIFKNAKYDRWQNHVVVHYYPPHEPEIANGMIGMPDVYIVPSAVILDL